MSDIALVCIGSILHAVTFTVGILVGTSLRKDTRHDSNEGTTKEQSWWHDAIGTESQGGARRSGGSSAGTVGAARASERVPVGRGAHWE